MTAWFCKKNCAFASLRDKKSFSIKGFSFSRRLIVKVGKILHIFSMAKMSEINLVQKARSGDRHAFDELLSLHYDSAYAFAFKFCLNRQDAEDITQEALIKAARHIFSFDGKAKFTTWLFRIVINTAKDHIKKEQTKRKYEHDFAAMQELEGQGSDNTLDRLSLLLKKLPVKQLEAVTLVYGEGMNHKEAAAIIGCAETTISWRIFQAKRHLKEQNLLVCFLVTFVVWRVR